MRSLAPRLTVIFVLALLAGLTVFPWEKFGVTVPSPFDKLIKPYHYGLDLHGGVELDYKVDLSALDSQSGSEVSGRSIVETLKKIIDTRVQTLGLAEPNIQSAQYGGESHIIVQIPVKDYGNISEEEFRAKNQEDIDRAKAVIGKVVQLEFRERKTTVTDADRVERRVIVDQAYSELQNTPFTTVGVKYRDTYENVGYMTASGSLPEGYVVENIDTVDLPYLSPVLQIKGAETIGMSGDVVTAPGGYGIIRITDRYDVPSIDASGATVNKKEYAYEALYVDESPSEWMPAKTADGRVLNDKYLLRANVDASNFLDISVNLVFNDEGKSIFAELTKRLVGKQIAIFVGGENLTAPVVSVPILDGSARITGNYTMDSARELADGINTGIVPAPIYLTSERSIDAKIGADALEQIVRAGIIGLIAIVVLLVGFYRVAGALAAVALIFYALLLVALVKAFGLTLSLASIAGVILSIGLAIDANILIFERMREALREKIALDRVIPVGFDHSWTAIWDSHVTSLVSALILAFIGVSLIKGFGIMLAIGILLSLFTAMWVSRVLLLFVGKKMLHNTELFIGMKK